MMISSEAGAFQLEDIADGHFFACRADVERGDLREALAFNAMRHKGRQIEPLRRARLETELQRLHAT